MNKKIKMNKERFQNLDQLDRIEYLLYQKDLKDRYSGSVTISMVWTVFYCWSIFMILALLMYIGFGSLTLFNVLPSLAIIIKWALIASVVMDILVMIIVIRRRKRLNDHFLKRGGYI